MITSHRPHQHPHINPMPLIALGVAIILAFGVITIAPGMLENPERETDVIPAPRVVYPAVAANAFPAYRQSERTLVEYQYAGAYSHIGDCGFDRYGLPESGAAGYCYVSPDGSTNKFPGKPVIKNNVKPGRNDQSDISTSAAPVVNDEQPATENIIPPEAPPQAQSETPPQAPPQPQPEVPKHCNKGEGNGSEGCDPGNHPEKGKDDEN